MDWIRINKNLPTHWKALDLADALDEPLAWAYMVRLWAWCIDNAADGRIPGRNALRTLEAAAGWSGESGRLAAAAVACGFVENVDGEYRVHDWDEHNGHAISQAEASIERKRQWREERKRGAVTVGRHEDATRGKPECHDDATRKPPVDETRPDETRRDQDLGGGGSAAALEPLDTAWRGAPIPWLVEEYDSTLRGGASLERRLWSWMSWRRMLVAPEHEPEPSPKKLKALAAGISAHGLELVRKAWLCWLVDQWAAERDPPHAVAPFLVPDQLAQFVSRASRFEWRVNPSHPEDWLLPGPS